MGPFARLTLFLCPKVANSSADCDGFTPGVRPFRWAEAGQAAELFLQYRSKKAPQMPNPKPRACKTLNDIKVGDEFRQPYAITDADVQKFAEISGDFNPAHFNEDYAKNTVFKGRIAHGMISVAKFSGVFGMDLPGLGAIWGAQSVKFLAPVKLNEPHVAIARAKEVHEKYVIFECWAEDAAGKRVLEGEGASDPAKR